MEEKIENGERRNQLGEEVNNFGEEKICLEYAHIKKKKSRLQPTEPKIHFRTRNYNYGNTFPEFYIVLRKCVS